MSAPSHSSCSCGPAWWPALCCALFFCFASPVLAPAQSPQAQSREAAPALPTIDPAHISQAREAGLTRDSVLIGDQLDWVLSLQVPQGTEVSFPEAPAQVMEGVELLALSLDTLRRKKDLLDLEARLRLTSFDSGSYALPYFPLYLRQAQGTPDTLWFKGPLLYVNTIPVDTATFRPYDLKAQIKYPLTAAEVFPWAAVILGLALLLWAVIRYVRRRKAHKPFFGAARPKEPAHVVALRAFDQIKAQQLWQSHKVKAYYTQLTDTLRTYFLDRWQIQALEQTSQELMESLKEEQKREEKLSAPLLESLSQLLEVADLAKFAKYTPPDHENEAAFSTAVRFVTATARLEETAAPAPETQEAEAQAAEAQAPEAASTEKTE